MADDDIARIRALLSRYSAGDHGAIAELIASPFYMHVPAPDEPTATQVFASFAADFRAAARDLTVDIPDLARSDDGLLRGTAVVTGTFSAPLWGKAGSGTPFDLRIPVTLRPVDGRFAVNVELAPPGAVAILRGLGLVNPPDQMHLPAPDQVVLPELLAKVLFTGQVADKPCAHLADVQVLHTAKQTCDDCGPGEIWPALRMCLSCGHVGCCDTATNKHAKAHWQQEGHPLMRSIRLSESWIWCYEDGALFQKRTLERLTVRLSGTT